jgi:hypothetical protein
MAADIFFKKDLIAISVTPEPFIGLGALRKSCHSPKEKISILFNFSPILCLFTPWVGSTHWKKKNLLRTATQP